MALDMEEGDWIPLFRKIRKSWLWQDSEALRAWIDLIMLANHHDGTFKFRCAIHPIQRGQLPTTHLSLAKRNGWSRDKVRTFLRLLEGAKSVTIEFRTFDTTKNEWVSTKTDSGFILLTIVNYPLRKAGQYLPTAEDAAESMGFRQGNSDDDRQGSHREASGMPQGSDTSKKGNKGNKGKKGGEGAPVESPTPEPETTLTPPSGPAAGKSQEVQESQTTASAPPPKAPTDDLNATPKEIAEHYREKYPRIPLKNCIEHVEAAVRKGAALPALMRAVRENRERMLLWTICDMVVDQAKRKPEAERENLPAEEAAVSIAARGDEQRDAARKAVSAKLAELPPAEVEALRREAETKAAADKVPALAWKTFVDGQILMRVAQRFGIQGV